MVFNNVSIFANTSTLTNNLTVAGNLQILSGSVLAPVSNTIFLGGNWINYNASGFTESNSLVNFNGSSGQTIATPGGETFSNVSVTNAATGIKIFNNIVIASSLVMNLGNIDLNGNTITLGTSALSAGTLSYISGIIINAGSFSRWFAKTTIAAGGIAGLFPVGTIANYRPLSVSVPSAPTTGGTITVAYIDAATNTTTSFNDGVDIIKVRKNLNWQISTATLAGGTYNISISGTGYGTIGNVGDLRITLGASVVGLPDVNAGSNLNPQINRKTLSLADLNNTFYIGSINSVNTSLPVNLVYFNVTFESSIVKLNWTTTAEFNNDHFTVQRSHDSHVWNDVIDIAGSGTTNNLSKYIAYDYDPYPGISYYRIKQLDKDGKFVFSVVKIVSNINSIDYKAYPNPTNNYIFINAPSELRLNFYNNTGQRILIPIYFMAGKMILNCTQLTAGTYFIESTVNGKIKTQIIEKK